MPLLIQASVIKKSFGPVHAVRGINLCIPAGEIYGLVGSDGAGKTTTLRLLVGALTPDQGEISMGGFGLKTHGEQARSLIGYLSQRFSLYEDLSVLENIRFFAEVRGLAAKEWKPRCMEILKFVGLDDFAGRLARQLSGGMKQKLGLASALVTRPKILLLDEPTTGVDPNTRQDFWQLIIRVVAQDETAVLLTTPYMDEAVRCTRLGFMRTGEMVAEGTPAQLRSSLVYRIIEVHSPSPFTLKEHLTRLPGVKDVHTFGDKLHVRVAPDQSAGILEAVTNAHSQWGLAGVTARLAAPSLEDVFIALSEIEKPAGSDD